MYVNSTYIMYARVIDMDLIPGIRGYRLSNPAGLDCASLKGALNVSVAICSYIILLLSVIRCSTCIHFPYLENYILHSIIAMFVAY